jgi:hypothetical protein
VPVRSRSRTNTAEIRCLTQTLFHHTAPRRNSFLAMNYIGYPRSYRMMADGLPRVDIFKLNREGLLGVEAPSIMLGKVQVSLDWEAVNFGSARPWFLCPTCTTRRRFLWLYDGRIGCTACLGLAYASPCRRWAGSLPLRRAARLRRRLGVDERPFSALPPKPRGRRGRPAGSWGDIVQEIRLCEREALGAIGPAHAVLMRQAHDTRR